MDRKPEETAAAGIGPLVLALAKTFHWAGLYGADHPVLAKRAGELHAALLGRLSLEPEKRLLLGIARDRILYRNEFLGEKQDLVVRLTESLYLRQVATVVFDREVTPEGLLELFRYLHSQHDGEDRSTPERFLREKGIAGISLSPYNYKELLSRKLLDAGEKRERATGREEEIWRLLLTADFTDRKEEEKVLEGISGSPEVLRAVLRRARDAAGGTAVRPPGEGSISPEVVQKLFGRIGMLVRALPEDRRREVLLSLDEGQAGPDAGGEGGESPLDIVLARSLTDEYSDDEFLDLLAALLSVEGRGGKRLKKVFGIIAGDRDIRGKLLPRVAERAKESRRVKNYYDLKAWETVERLLLSRSEESYLESDHARFLESISALRKPYLARLGENPGAGPALPSSFLPEALRRKATLVLLELLGSRGLQEEFHDILEEIRKSLPNLVSRGETALLETTLLSLESAAGSLPAERGSAVREVLSGADFGHIVELALGGEAGESQPVGRILARYGEIAAPPLLDRLLNEPDAGRRRSLLRLAPTLGPAAIPSILERMAHPKWYFVRNLCILLGEIGDRRAAPALIDAVSHPDHRVRREAIMAIGKMGIPEAVPHLGNILVEEGIFSSSREEPIRIDAASALYRIGGTEAVGYLHRAKGSKRKAVRSHCERLLRRLEETR